MICYKDRVWCNFNETCDDGEICDWAYTHEVAERADAWGRTLGQKKGNAPVCFYSSPPPCYREIKSE